MHAASLWQDCSIRNRTRGTPPSKQPRPRQQSAKHRGLRRLWPTTRPRLSWNGAPPRRRRGSPAPQRSAARRRLHRALCGLTCSGAPGSRRRSRCNTSVAPTDLGRSTHPSRGRGTARGRGGTPSRRGSCRRRQAGAYPRCTPRPPPGRPRSKPPSSSPGAVTCRRASRSGGRSRGASTRRLRRRACRRSAGRRRTSTQGRPCGRQRRRAARRSCPRRCPPAAATPRSPWRGPGRWRCRRSGGRTSRQTEHSQLEASAQTPPATR
mmetsp:Transcript_59850/g.193855  ORF Transcript_59850/g.193855 Transcript_59850/m.193855 type:complete len:265 (+) Transcript_59850:114-908(+)